MLELKLNLKHDDDISAVQSTSHKYAHGFVVFCLWCAMSSCIVVDLQPPFTHIHQGCSTGIGAIMQVK